MSALRVKCKLLPSGEKEFLLDDYGRVSARVQWRGQPVTVIGRVGHDFIVENEEVIVRLEHATPPLDGADTADVWVPASSIAAPDVLELRAHIWELPAGSDRELALRRLSMPVAESVADRGDYVRLAQEMPGATSLLFVIDVPLHDATNYLWRFSSACRDLKPRRLPWQPPGPVTHEVRLDTGSRANASHYANQLALWLPTRQFWSVFTWEKGRLVHTLQFSVAAKLTRLLQRRFRLRAL